LLLKELGQEIAYGERVQLLLKEKSRVDFVWKKNASWKNWGKSPSQAPVKMENFGTSRVCLGKLIKRNSFHFSHL